MDLHKAAREGNLQEVKQLCDLNDVNEKDPLGATPLHEAAAGGHALVVEFLLEQKANAGVTDKFGRTPLYHAAWNGSAAIIKALLEQEGVDIDANCICGTTALSRASENGHAEVVSLLLDCSASQDTENINGDTALALATRNGHDDVKQLLVENRLPSAEELKETCWNFFASHVETKNLGELLHREQVERVAKETAEGVLTLMKKGWEEEFALELGVLALYDIAILIGTCNPLGEITEIEQMLIDWRSLDDDMSMGFKENNKSELEQGLKTISRIYSMIAKRNIRAIRFTVQEKGYDNIGEEDLNELVKNHRFSGATQLDKPLKRKILDPFANSDQLPRPLLVVTITDGKTKGTVDALKKVISDSITGLEYFEALAFQFARVGKEEGAAKFLHALDSCIGVGGFVECPSGGWGFDDISKDRQDIERRSVVKNLLIGAIRDAYYNHGPRAEQRNVSEREEKRSERERQEKERQGKGQEAAVQLAEQTETKRVEELKRKEIEIESGILKADSSDHSSNLSS